MMINSAADRTDDLKKMVPGEHDNFRDNQYMPLDDLPSPHDEANAYLMDSAIEEAPVSKSWQDMLLEYSTGTLVAAGVGLGLLMSVFVIVLSVVFHYRRLKKRAVQKVTFASDQRDGYVKRKVTRVRYWTVKDKSKKPTMEERRLVPEENTDTEGSESVSPLTTETEDTRQSDVASPRQTLTTDETLPSPTTVGSDYYDELDWEKKAMHRNETEFQEEKTKGDDFSSYRAAAPEPPSDICAQPQKAESQPFTTCLQDDRKGFYHKSLISDSKTGLTKTVPSHGLMNKPLSQSHFPLQGVPDSQTAPLQTVPPFPCYDLRYDSVTKSISRPDSQAAHIPTDQPYAHDRPMTQSSSQLHTNYMSAPDLQQPRPRHCLCAECCYAPVPTVTMPGTVNYQPVLPYSAQQTSSPTHTHWPTSFEKKKSDYSQQEYLYSAHQQYLHHQRPPEATLLHNSKYQQQQSLQASNLAFQQNEAQEAYDKRPQPHQSSETISTNINIGSYGHMNSQIDGHDVQSKGKKGVMSQATYLCQNRLVTNSLSKITIGTHENLRSQTSNVGQGVIEERSYKDLRLDQQPHASEVLEAAQTKFSLDEIKPYRETPNTPTNSFSNDIQERKNGCIMQHSSKHFNQSVSNVQAGKNISFDDEKIHIQKGNKISQKEFEHRPGLPPPKDMDTGRDYHPKKLPTKSNQLPFDGHCNNVNGLVLKLNHDMEMTDTRKSDGHTSQGVCPNCSCCGIERQQHNHKQEKDKPGTKTESNLSLRPVEHCVHVTHKGPSSVHHEGQNQFYHCHCNDSSPATDWQETDIQIFTKCRMRPCANKTSTHTDSCSSDASGYCSKSRASPHEPPQYEISEEGVQKYKPLEQEQQKGFEVLLTPSHPEHEVRIEIEKPLGNGVSKFIRESDTDRGHAGCKMDTKKVSSNEARKVSRDLTTDKHEETIVFYRKKQMENANKSNPARTNRPRQEYNYSVHSSNYPGCPNPSPHSRRRRRSDERSSSAERSPHFIVDSHNVSKAHKRYACQAQSYSNLPFPKWPHYPCSPPSVQKKKGGLNRSCLCPPFEYTNRKKSGISVEYENLPLERKVSGLSKIYENRSNFYRKAPLCEHTHNLYSPPPKQIDLLKKQDDSYISGEEEVFQEGKVSELRRTFSRLGKRSRSPPLPTYPYYPCRSASPSPPKTGGNYKSCLKQKPCKPYPPKPFPYAHDDDALDASECSLRHPRSRKMVENNSKIDQTAAIYGYLQSSPPYTNNPVADASAATKCSCGCNKIPEGTVSCLRHVFSDHARHARRQPCAHPPKSFYQPFHYSSSQHFYERESLDPSQKEQDRHERHHYRYAARASPVHGESAEQGITLTSHRFSPQHQINHRYPSCQPGLRPKRRDSFESSVVLTSQRHTPEHQVKHKYPQCYPGKAKYHEAFEQDIVLTSQRHTPAQQARHQYPSCIKYSQNLGNISPSRHEIVLSSPRRTPIHQTKHQYPQCPVVGCRCSSPAFSPPHNYVDLNKRHCPCSSPGDYITKRPFRPCVCPEQSCYNYFDNGYREARNTKGWKNSNYFSSLDQSLPFPKYPYYPCGSPSPPQQAKPIIRATISPESEPEPEWNYKSPNERNVAILTQSFSSNRSKNVDNSIKTRRISSTLTNRLDSDNNPTRRHVANVRQELTQLGARLTGRNISPSEKRNLERRHSRGQRYSQSEIIPPPVEESSTLAEGYLQTSSAQERPPSQVERKYSHIEKRHSGKNKMLFGTEEMRSERRQSSTEKDHLQSSVQESRPYQIARKPSQGERRPSQTERRPSQIERRPSQTERRPSQTERRPSQTERRPSQTERRPSQMERRPSQMERRPSQMEGRHSQMERRPSQMDTPHIEARSQTERKPSQMEKRHSQMERRPSQMEKRHSQMERRPSQMDTPHVEARPQTERKPSRMERRPSEMERRPSEMERRPSQMERRPSQMERRPSQMEKSPQIERRTSQMERKPSQMDTPSRMERRTSQMEISPSQMERRPSQMEESPSQMERRHHMERRPSQMERRPSQIEESPSQMERRPEMERKPSQIERRPSQMERKPSQMERRYLVDRQREFDEEEMEYKRRQSVSNTDKIKAAFSGRNELINLEKPLAIEDIRSDKEKLSPLVDRKSSDTKRQNSLHKVKADRKLSRNEQKSELFVDNMQFIPLEIQTSDDNKRLIDNIGAQFNSEGRFISSKFVKIEPVQNNVYNRSVENGQIAELHNMGDNIHKLSNSPGLKSEKYEERFVSTKNINPEPMEARYLSSEYVEPSPDPQMLVEVKDSRFSGERRPSGERRLLGENPATHITVGILENSSPTFIHLNRISPQDNISSKEKLRRYSKEDYDERDEKDNKVYTSRKDVGELKHVKQTDRGNTIRVLSKREDAFALSEQSGGPSHPLHSSYAVTASTSRTEDRSENYSDHNIYGHDRKRNRHHGDERGGAVKVHRNRSWNHSIHRALPRSREPMRVAFSRSRSSLWEYSDKPESATCLCCERCCCCSLENTSSHNCVDIRSPSPNTCSSASPRLDDPSFTDKVSPAFWPTTDTSASPPSFCWKATPQDDRRRRSYSRNVYNRHHFNTSVDADCYSDDGCESGSKNMYSN